jgi:hypothetical protein
MPRHHEDTTPALSADLPAQPALRPRRPSGPMPFQTPLAPARPQGRNARPSRPSVPPSPGRIAILPRRSLPSAGRSVNL